MALNIAKNYFSKKVPMDGNAAAAHVAYHMSEAAFLYPITPSTPMGEAYDSWSCKGKKNIWGRVPEVKVLQSEAGASGALHGAASVGTFTTTFTASQGLLLMIPNMLKTAGELWPTVFHVAARAVSMQALSIQGDHSDIMCCKNTGFAFLSSATVQQCMDMAAISHMSTVDSEIPFVHFFEGFRLSHQIDPVVPLTMDEMKYLMPFQKLEEIRKRALNPAHPMILGFMMMSYDNVYVASCSLGSQKDLKHFIKCLKEAESFPGPSLILVYCNCILHHIKGAIQAGGAASLKAHKLAVEGGYWPVYSYDPRREKEGKNPFEMISKKPDLKKLNEFLDMEVRFNGLKRNNPELSKQLREQLGRDVMRRYSRYVAFGKGFEK